MSKPIKRIAVNKKARFNYHIEEEYEAGIVLTGTEIKSVRRGRVSLTEAYAGIRGNEALIYNMHIAQYEQGNRYNHDPKRTRKLLLNRNEIARLAGVTAQKGRTIVPLEMYIKGSWAKLKLGVGRGKRVHDKRRAIADRQVQREMDRAMKDNRYS